VEQVAVIEQSVGALGTCMSGHGRGAAGTFSQNTRTGDVIGVHVGFGAPR